MTAHKPMRGFGGFLTFCFTLEDYSLGTRPKGMPWIHKYVAFEVDKKDECADLIYDKWCEAKRVIDVDVARLKRRHNRAKVRNG